MQADFDPAEFVNRIGRKLVSEFEYASAAGTPGLIGAARENPARKQLEKLLPPAVQIGSGIVIDSFGNRSTQQDIVLFERDYCPVYSINDTPEATYFPVEGVLAVGEIKSTMDTPKIIDALIKIKSAKILRRFAPKEPPRSCSNYRTYGFSGTFAAVASTDYEQDRKSEDQIFGFVLCKEFKNSPESALEACINFINREKAGVFPNIIISLEDGFIQNCRVEKVNREEKIELQQSAMTANAMLVCPETRRAFSILVERLRQHAREGRTVPLAAFDRYMVGNAGEIPVSAVRMYEGATT